MQQRSFELSSSNSFPPSLVQVLTSLDRLTFRGEIFLTLALLFAR